MVLKCRLLSAGCQAGAPCVHTHHAALPCCPCGGMGMATRLAMRDVYVCIYIPILVMLIIIIFPLFIFNNNNNCIAGIAHRAAAMRVRPPLRRIFHRLSNMPHIVCIRTGSTHLLRDVCPHRPRAASARAVCPHCICQWLYLPRAASVKGCIMQGLFAPL